MRKLESSLMLQAFGLALFFCMFRFPFLGFFLNDQVSLSSDTHAVIETTLVAMGIVFFVVASRHGVFKSKGVCSWTGGAICTVGLGIMALATQAKAFSQIALLPAGFLFALGVILLSEAWFQSLRVLPSKVLIPLGMFAFAVSMASGLLEFLPSTAKAIFFVLIPLASGAFAYLTHDASFTDGLLEDYERPNFPEALQIDILGIVFIVAELIFATLIRALWAHQGIGSASSGNTWSTYLFSLCLGLLFSFLTLKSKYAEEATLVTSGSSLIVLFVAACAYALGDETGIAAAAITSCFSVLQVVLMCLISLTMRGKDRPYSGSAGIFIAFMGFSSALAYSIMPKLLGFQGVAPSSLTLPTVFFAIGFIVLVVAGCFVVTLLRSAAQFREWQTAVTVKTAAIKTAHIIGAQKEEPSSAESDSETLTEKLATTYGLTEREIDIVILLSNGFTARRAAEELYLSVNTVNSYTKTIYRKMDVHKKDELIDKVTELL